MEYYFSKDSITPIGVTPHAHYRSGVDVSETVYFICN